MSWLIGFCGYGQDYGLMTMRALDGMTTSSGVPSASDDELFRDWIFGRDGSWIARRMARWLPGLSRRIVYTLASLQGTKTDFWTDEAPGAIPHQHGSTLSGVEYSDVREKRIRDLARVWHLPGADDLNEVTVYYSLDATALFVLAVAELCQWYGPRELDVRINHRVYGPTTMRTCVERALQWITQRLESEPAHLIASRYGNPHALKLQTLRDSSTSLYRFDENGKMRMVQLPMASLDAQALTYDALLAGRKLLGSTDGYDPKLLRDAVFDHFWDPQLNRFASAVECNGGGTSERVEMLTSLENQLLDTKLLDGVPGQHKLAESIIDRAFDPKVFWTPIGPRSVALTEPDFPYSSYHGKDTVWAINTHIFACGLERYGYRSLAQKLFQMTVNLPPRASLAEFIYVMADGVPLLDPDTEDGPGKIRIVATNKPEIVHLWPWMTWQYALWHLAKSDEALHGGPLEQRIYDQLMASTYDPATSPPSWVDLAAGDKAEKALGWKL